MESQDCMHDACCVVSSSSLSVLLLLPDQILRPARTPEVPPKPDIEQKGTPVEINV